MIESRNTPKRREKAGVACRALVLPGVENRIPIERIVAAAQWHSEPQATPPGESWPIKALHLVTDSEFSPRFDFVALLESPDGVINELRMRFGAAEKPDTEGVVNKGGLLHLVAVEWNEKKVVENVFLAFLRPHIVAHFLTEFSAHVADLVESVGQNDKLTHGGPTNEH